MHPDEKINKEELLNSAFSKVSGSRNLREDAQSPSGYFIWTIHLLDYQTTCCIETEVMWLFLYNQKEDFIAMPCICVLNINPTLYISDLLAEIKGYRCLGA